MTEATAAGADSAGADPGRAVVEANGLTRRFGEIVAVERASFRVGAGEVLGLIGPNGAGKSTLIKMLTTLLPPSEGGARVAGFDIRTQSADVRRSIGYVPQLLSADGELTGYENLLLSARLYLVPRRERAARIAEALQRMGLTEARDRLVRGYSGGMIRRLEIAQSTLHRPRVIFLDEPTVGLDPTGRLAVWQHVRALRDQIGAAIVLTTHYMEEADELCDRIGVLDSGRLVALGTPEALKRALGPGATLEDVFASATGGTLEAQGDLRRVRLDREGITRHG
jgi:ABC-2 type transport system ATP-binding protein